MQNFEHQTPPLKENNQNLILRWFNHLLHRIQMHEQHSHYWKLQSEADCDDVSSWWPTCCLIKSSPTATFVHFCCLLRNWLYLCAPTEKEWVKSDTPTCKVKRTTPYWVSVGVRYNSKERKRCRGILRQCLMFCRDVNKGTVLLKIRFCTARGGDDKFAAWSSISTLKWKVMLKVYLSQSDEI